MRHALVFSAVLLASPIVGQEDPLPPITPRAQTPVLIALAVEPVHAVPTVTLEDAARGNDYATFHELFEQTQNPAWEPLHELWTYSVNDPIGAFYGAEMYERFAALYPGFDAYIDEHKIVDDRGNVFYPTSETRAFLLARALEGRTVAPPEEIRVARRTRTTPPAPRVRMQKAEAAPEPVELKPEPQPAALRPAPVPAVAAPAPVVAESVPAPEAGAAPPPIIAASVIPELPQAVIAEQPTDFTARGILLIIIGLVGIGFLAMILRAPSSSPPASDLGKAPH